MDNLLIFVKKNAKSSRAYEENSLSGKVISTWEDTTEKIRNELLKRLQEEGWIDSIYNTAKELLGIGIIPEDLEKNILANYDPIAILKAYLSEDGKKIGENSLNTQTRKYKSMG